MRQLSAGVFIESLEVSSQLSKLVGFEEVLREFRRPRRSRVPRRSTSGVRTSKGAFLATGQS